MKKFRIVLSILVIAIMAAAGVLIFQNLENDQSADSASADNTTIVKSTCQKNDPPVKLISKSIPKILKPNQKLSVKVTVQNCSNETWKPYSTSTKSGYSFGTSSPRDNTIWGLNRIPLPGSIPPGSIATVSFAITAPSNYGAHILQLGLVQENVQWYRPYLQPDIIFVPQYSQCSGLDAIKNSNTDASSILQKCIDSAANNSILEIPAGKYYLNNQIWISKPLTIVTKGLLASTNTCGLSEKNCAVFIAGKNFPAKLTTDERYSSLIVIRKRDFSSVDNVHLKNIVIDGNRANRPVNQFCTSAQIGKSRLINIDAELTRGSFFYVESRNAGCGSAMQVFGRDNLFIGNWIHDNGASSAGANKVPWSDGASLTGDYLQVMNNTFENNTDLNLVLWGAAYSDISLNTYKFTRPGANAFGSLGLATSTKYLPNQAYTDSHVSYNFMECNYQCGFGIVVGLLSWDQTADVLLDGYIHHNSVDKAFQGILTDGAGTATRPVRLGFNTITGSGGYNTGCGWITGKYNVNPSDVIINTDGTIPDSKKAWRCALPSCVFNTNYCRVPDNATFMQISAPSVLTAGQKYKVSVTYKNTGTTTWEKEGTPNTYYRLGSQAPQDNMVWISNTRVLLNKSIKPGESHTFTFDITAPSKPGKYNFQWQMVHEGVQWFGQKTTLRTITVKAS